MSQVVTFKRSDGVELTAEKGSVAWELMENDGSFVRTSEDAPEVSEVPELEVPESEVPEVADPVVKKKAVAKKK